MGVSDSAKKAFAYWGDIKSPLFTSIAARADFAKQIGVHDGAAWQPPTLDSWVHLGCSQCNIDYEEGMAEHDKRSVEAAVAAVVAPPGQDKMRCMVDDALPGLSQTVHPAMLFFN